MKTIEIDEDVLALTPKEFKDLPEGNYKLTKTENTRPNGMVYAGDSVIGPAEVVNVIGLPGIKVYNHLGPTRDLTYLRTSPIVEVLDSTDTTITFRTEGGVYKLERA